MSQRQNWGVYVHIPFCQARCTYCDFNTVTGMTEVDHRRYVDAVLTEWAMTEPLDGRMVSLYFGGGTPSLIEPALIGRVVAAVMDRAGAVSSDLEITVETNPGTVTAAKLQQLKNAGVNRLSIGAQALQDHHLAALNRIHDSGAIVETVTMARAAGFSNISLDAIYGIPEHTLAQWRDTVEGLLALNPVHLSLYSLIVEEGTPLKRAVDRGRARLPESDMVADMADWARDRLESEGFVAYEISNYARKGFESRHNQLYWQMEPYLALGAGSHAYVPGRRSWNVRGVRQYMECVESGASPEADHEILSPEEEMREYLWLGLRQRRGVDLSQFAQRFGRPADAAFPTVLSDLTAKGLMTTRSGFLTLTSRGRDVANVVSRALVDAPIAVDLS